MSDSESLGPYHAFGAWLREKRLAAKLASQPRAEIRARAQGLKLINQGKLSHIERGMNGNPDPAFLSQLADLYHLNYVDVVAQWMRVRYRVVNDADSVLVGRGRMRQQTAHHEGESNVPATARIRELEDRLRMYEAIVSHSNKLASELVTITSGRGEGRPLTLARAGRGRHPRKND